MEKKQEIEEVGNEKHDINNGKEDENKGKGDKNIGKDGNSRNNIVKQRMLDLVEDFKIKEFWPVKVLNFLLFGGKRAN